MTTDEQKQALAFAQSVRGRYIISQALTIAARELMKVDPPMREASNIEDMEYLARNVFPIYAIAEGALGAFDTHDTTQEKSDG